MLFRNRSLLAIWRHTVRDASISTFVACLHRRRGGAVSLQLGGASLDVEASRPKNSHFGPI
jgi:hypothetical protein